MQRDLQYRLLEALYSRPTLCSAELAPIRRHLKLASRLLPSCVSNEDIDHRRILRRTSPKKALVDKMALIVIPGYRRWHRSGPNFYFKHRTQRN